MKRTIKLVFVLSFTLSFFVVSKISVSASNGQKFEINHFENDGEETYQLFGLNNYRRQRTNSTELNTILEEYPIDMESFSNSENVYLSKSRIYHLSPEMLDVGGGGSTSSGKYDEVSYSDSEGYLTKLLIVYDKGYVKSGQKLFHAVSYINFHKTFTLRYTDSLVIWSGYNSVVEYSYDNSAIFTYNTLFLGVTKKSHAIYASVDYSYTNGVRYDVKLPGNPTLSLAIDWKFEGDYYFVATETTSVNSQYIHNEKILSGALSISWGPFGLTISGDNTSYNGKGITIYV